VCDHTKFQQKWPDGFGRRPPSWILNRHLWFLKVWVFDKLVSSRRLICAILQNFVKIGQTVSETPQFFILKMAVVAILDFEIFTFLVYGHIGRPNIHRHTKFHQNRSNRCWDIAFNNFQNGGRPPSWIFKSLICGSGGKLWRTNMCHLAKFHQNRPNDFWDIVIFRFSRWPPSAILDLLKVDFLNIFRVRRANVRQRAKFCIYWSNRCWNIAIYLFFKMAAVHHFGFVGQILGRPTTRIWFITVQNLVAIALVVSIGLIQVRIFCTFGLKTPIHAHSWAILGVKWGKIDSFWIIIPLGMQ